MYRVAIFCNDMYVYSLDMGIELGLYYYGCTLDLYRHPGVDWMWSIQNIITQMGICMHLTSLLQDYYSCMLLVYWTYFLKQNHCLKENPLPHSYSIPPFYGPLSMGVYPPWFWGSIWMYKGLTTVDDTTWWYNFCWTANTVYVAQ